MATTLRDFAAKHAPSPELEQSDLQLARSRVDALADIPASRFTPDLLWAALERSPGSLRFVPQHMRTPGLVKHAVTCGNIKRVPGPAEYMLADEFTLELSMLAVQGYGSNLLFIPPRLQTHDVRMAAVREDGNAIEYVPYHERSEALCVAAVRNNVQALKHIFGTIRTDGVLQAAIQESADALPMIDRHELTPGLLRLAAKRHGYQAIAQLPPQAVTDQLRMIALAATARVLQGEQLADADIIARAIEYAPDCIAVAPSALLRPGHWRRAISCNHRLLQHMPRDAMTREFVDIALASMLNHQVRRQQDGSSEREQFYIDAANEDPWFLLRYLPPTLMTNRVVIAALEKSPACIKLLAPSDIAGSPVVASWVNDNWARCTSALSFDHAAGEIVELGLQINNAIEDRISERVAQASSAQDTTPQRMRT